MHGNKYDIVNEKFSKLWHKRVDLVSINRIIKLVNQSVLKDIFYFDTCVDCIKGK